MATDSSPDPLDLFSTFKKFSATKAKGQEAYVTHIYASWI